MTQGYTEKFFNEVPKYWELYELDEQLRPQALKDIRGDLFDVDAFKKSMHEAGITQKQAQVLWGKFCNTAFEGLQQAQRQAQERTYTNEQIGEGETFLTPEQAKGYLTKIMNDKEHDYWNEKSLPEARDLAVSLVNRLDQIAHSQEGGVLDGYIDAYYAEKAQDATDIHGKGYKEKKYSSNDPNAIPLTDEEIAQQQEEAELKAQQMANKEAELDALSEAEGTFEDLT